MRKNLLVLLDVLEDLECHVCADELELDVVPAVVVDEPRRSEQETEAILALAPQDGKVAPAARVAHLVVLLFRQVGDSSAQVDDLALLEIASRKDADLDEGLGVSPRGRGGKRGALLPPRTVAGVLVPVRLVEGDARVGSQRKDVAFGVVGEEQGTVAVFPARTE